MINGELGMVHIFSKQLDVQQFHIPYGVQNRILDIAGHTHPSGDRVSPWQQ